MTERGKITPDPEPTGFPSKGVELYHAREEIRSLKEKLFWTRLVAAIALIGAMIAVTFLTELANKP